MRITYVASVTAAWQSPGIFSERVVYKGDNIIKAFFEAIRTYLKNRKAIMWNVEVVGIKQR